VDSNRKDERIAKETGIPQPTICRIRTGVTANPEPDTVDRIMKALGLTVRIVKNEHVIASSNKEDNMEMLFERVRRAIRENSNYLPRSHPEASASNIEILRYLADSFIGPVLDIQDVDF
jgi:transcriptional regulator with XRE-family HTH domain